MTKAISEFVDELIKKIEEHRAAKIEHEDALQNKFGTWEHRKAEDKVIHTRHELAKFLLDEDFLITILKDYQRLERIAQDRLEANNREIDKKREIFNKYGKLLKEWLSPYDGWSDKELEKRCDPATIARVYKTRMIMARVDRDRFEAGDAA